MTNPEILKIVLFWLSRYSTCVMTSYQNKNMKSPFKSLSRRFRKKRKKIDILGQWMANSGLVHIPEQVFGDFDNSTLANCRLVSKQWSQFLARIWFIRKLRYLANKIQFSTSTQFDLRVLKSLEIFRNQAEELELENFIEVLEKFYAIAQLYETKLSLIQFAVKQNSFKFIEIALKQNIDVIRYDNHGGTLLHVALQNGHLRLLKLLCDHCYSKNIDLNQVDSYGLPIGKDL